MEGENTATNTPTPAKANRSNVLIAIIVFGIIVGSSTYLALVNYTDLIAKPKREGDIDPITEILLMKQNRAKTGTEQTEADSGATDTSSSIDFDAEAAALDTTLDEIDDNNLAESTLADIDADL
ncbi:MAG: hypothetical protein AAB360_03460 [Patescibacteria group bacterium]